MSLDPRTRSTSQLHLRPLGAIAISLATVLVLTALLGVVFLPHEIRQLAGGPTVNIVDQQFIENGRREVLLTRRMETGIGSGVLWEVVLRNVTTAAPARVLFPASSDPLATAATSGGSRMFVGRVDGQIFALDLRAAEPVLAVVGHYPHDELKALCCTSSGDVLVAGGPGGIHAWNTEERLLSWSRDDVKRVCWAIDARSAELFVETAEGRLLELDLATGRTLRVIRSSEQSAIAMALSADGARIARLGWSGELEMVDRASGLPIWTDLRSSHRASSLVGTMKFSPDGQELVAVHPNDSSCLRVWNASTGRHIRDLRGHSAPISGLTFTPDGRLRSWAVDGTVRTWSSQSNDTVDGELVAGQSAAGNGASARQVREPAPGAFGALLFPTRR